MKINIRINMKINIRINMKINIRISMHDSRLMTLRHWDWLRDDPFYENIRNSESAKKLQTSGHTCSVHNVEFNYFLGATKSRASGCMIVRRYDCRTQSYPIECSGVAPLLFLFSPPPPFLPRLLLQFILCRLAFAAPHHHYYYPYYLLLLLSLLLTIIIPTTYYYQVFQCTQAQSQHRCPGVLEKAEGLSARGVIVPSSCG